nr:uncharacterized protein LOC129163303 isoform X2 [Nothobranchius furzeri]
MALFYFGFFLVSVLLKAAPNCSAGSAAYETVIGFKDKDVVLSCSDFNSTSCNRLRWVKAATETSAEKVIFLWPQTSQTSQDVKRATLETIERGEIRLKSLEKSDEGLYSCEISAGWDRVRVKNTSLIVRECEPLKPKNAINGGSVKLDCQVNATHSNISWAKMKGTQSVSLKANGSLLTIQSVSAADYGWYRCSYSVGQSQRCFMINLQVQEAVFVPTVVPDPEAKTTQSAATAREMVQTGEKLEGGGTLVPVLSVVCVVVVLAALTGLFLHHKQRVRQPLRHIAGRPKDFEEFYENVTLPNAANTTDRVNSLYQFQEESLSTFQT